jgi:hypothetical protein
MRSPHNQREQEEKQQALRRVERLCTCNTFRLSAKLPRIRSSATALTAERREDDERHYEHGLEKEARHAYTSMAQQK